MEEEYDTHLRLLMNEIGVIFRIINHEEGLYLYQCPRCKSVKISDTQPFCVECVGKRGKVGDKRKTQTGERIDDLEGATDEAFKWYYAGWLDCEVEEDMDTAFTDTFHTVDEWKKKKEDVRRTFDLNMKRMRRHKELIETVAQIFADFFKGD